MCISPLDLREHVIKPALTSIGRWSPEVEQLLLGTAITRLHIGNSICSLKTKSLGIYGLTAKSHWELWDTYLVHNPDLASKIRGFASQRQFLVAPDDELITNLAYATLITWGIYQSQSVTLSSDAKLVDLAEIWFTHFQCQLYPPSPNTSQQIFVDAYNRFLSPKHSSLAA